MIETPHRRRNPLTAEWVLVSPQRSKRPWLGQVEKTRPDNLPAYEETCYLCPSNQRANGVKNPDYTGTYVFDNDFSALLPQTDSTKIKSSSLFQIKPERGTCRVICFSPRHDLTLPELPLTSIKNVIETWIHQSADLGGKDFISYVQIFENKGAMMGCSNPHPHSQIWANEFIPSEPAKELVQQSNYLAENCRPLLTDYLIMEQKNESRIIAANDYFTALVPFWAIWPFEIIIVAHRIIARLIDLNEAEVDALAQVIKIVTTRFDNLFSTSFPYSMGFHQAPFDGQDHPEWILHAHFYPPLLRSATIRKFQVGYELLAMPQRDITAETAAELLRKTSAIHYKSKI